MALEIRIQGGRAEPRVVCDHCGEVIEDARTGNYQWRVDDRGGCAEDGAIYFTHKGCCHDFEAARGGRGHWSWAPLSCLPVYLAANLRSGPKEARRSAELMASL